MAAVNVARLSDLAAGWGTAEDVDGVEVSFASRPGSTNRPNEDFVAASPSVAVVLDGLSAPPALGTGCVHGTPWFVAHLGTQVVRAATTAHDEPLTELVAGAITRVRSAPCPE